MDKFRFGESLSAIRKSAGHACSEGQRPRIGGEVQMTTRQIGRDAKTGRIIPVAVAKARKATAVVETVKVPNPRKRK